MTFRRYYIPSNGLFICLNGNQSVPWSAVNNENCDCADGSDEPGTSACENGRFVVYVCSLIFIVTNSITWYRFYCEPELRFISSLRVNDGLCDCCDGSDEWKGVTLSPETPIEGKF